MTNTIKGVTCLNYRGYEILENNGAVAVKGIEDFNPVHIFECGQCFRWRRQNDGSYTGVAGGTVVNVAYDNNGTFKIENSSLEDFINIWFEYFDLGRNYSSIKRSLARDDDVMEKAVEFGRGIRILKQDFWETLVSFIISANNRIPMIMKVVEAISRDFGKEIIFNRSKYYSFPGAGNLADAGLEQLKVCGGGFRCRYIADTARMVREGVVDIGKLDGMETGEARDELMRFPGVGRKVADCVLLYGGGRYDVFPTDLWVKRIMEELYFKRKATIDEIHEFAAKRFGRLAGFAQQYLFYYARENRIGAK